MRRMQSRERMHACFWRGTVADKSTTIPCFPLCKFTLLQFKVDFKHAWKVDWHISLQWRDIYFKPLFKCLYYLQSWAWSKRLVKVGESFVIFPGIRIVNNTAPSCPGVHLQTIQMKPFMAILYINNFSVRLISFLDCYSHIVFTMMICKMYKKLVFEWKMVAPWKEKHKPGVMLWFRCDDLNLFRKWNIGHRFVLGTLWVGKKGQFWTRQWPMCFFYLHVDAPVCLYAYVYVRVWGGMFVFECDSVYFVGLRTLRLSVCCSLWWEHTYVFAWRPGSMWVCVW